MSAFDPKRTSYSNAATVFAHADQRLHRELACPAEHVTYTFVIDIRLDAAGLVAEQSERNTILAADVCLFQRRLLCH